MKKSILLFTFLITFSYINSQENKFATKRAANAVSVISSEMDLTESQAQFLQETLYAKYSENLLKIKGKNLPAAAKKEIFKNGAATAKKRLLEKFSKEDVLKINKLEKQSIKKK